MAADLKKGSLKPADLNGELVKNILTDVRGGLTSGFGSKFFDYTDNPKGKLALNQNLYRFSGAKTYQELAKLNFAVSNKKSVADIKKEALKINDEYNRTYLETEIINASRSGAMFEKWHKFQSQKHLYPNLKYKTVKDNRVRLEHKQLHDVVKPIDDEFWDTWFPPNGHRCRCYTTQTDEKATPGTPEGNPTPGFHGNVGKTNMAFNEDEHPYFIFPAEDAKKIKESFENLKLAEPDYNLVHKNKKATLEVSTWADPNDVSANFTNAKILVDQLKVSMKIRPHSDLENITNPEYEIDGKMSDLKNIEKVNGITNGFDAAKRQMGYGQNHYSVVFNLDKVAKIKLDDITKQLNNKFNAKRGKKIDRVFFIRNEKAAELTREDILKKDFSALSKIL